MISRQAGRLLTLEEAAAHFRVSVSTLYRWCRAGRVPAFKIGRGWLIPLSAFVTASPRSYAAFRQFLTKTFGSRTRTRGQHWLVCAEGRRDYEELLGGIEEFVLSRRKSRLGRIWWEEGPEISMEVTDKLGGFEVRLLSPREAPDSAAFVDVIESTLREQSGRSSATYVLVGGDVVAGRSQAEWLRALDDRLARVARERRMVIFSSWLLGEAAPWTAMVEMMGRYDGVLCCAMGHLYAAQGRTIDGT